MAGATPGTRSTSGDTGDRGSGAPRWVYVAGDGRSGSTLLGSLLAGGLDGFDCGELHLLWVSLVDGRLCTCGEKVARCPVWAEVAAAVRDQLGLPDDEAGAAIVRGRLRQRQLLGPRLPEPLPAELELRQATESAIERVTGAAVLVDSSKLSTVLWTASRLPRPLAVVHLVRDPRAVAFSWSRPTPDPSLGGALMERKSAWRSGGDWLRAHATTERVLRRLDGVPVVRTRYEDLVADPAGELAPLVARMGDDAVAFTADRERPSHAMAGNPTRFRAGQRVEADERWRRESAPVARVVVTALTVPLLRRYGYRLLPR